MRYICPECGGEIPEDLDFCHLCGRKRDNTIRLDQSGRFIPPEENECASCGTAMQPDDIFCPSCGEQRSKTQTAAFRPKLAKYAWIGIVLAFIPGALWFVPIPGLFSVFGLGHLYFRRWSRAAGFLLISAFLFYANIELVGAEPSLLTDIIFWIITLFFFFVQAMEALVLAFMPSKTSE
ncbi:MAG: zinc ribbon domain-containing protein [Candidatus Methanoplasma sp.]|jgi:predicted nucleic acid-binding Zn ribbon protein|nr:zinc ribbon domain-containing protein [Candidatus Methanoplasma sp.]